jgi:hypothetical protein
MDMFEEVNFLIIFDNFNKKCYICNMISTAEIVKSIIKTSPLLEDGLTRGIINYSALAHELRPQIEKELLKPITRGSIVMALKRVSKELKKKQRQIKKINLSQLSIRSDLVELTYINSETIAAKYKEVLILAERKRGAFAYLSHGIRESMIIISKEIASEAEEVFKKEKLIIKFENISSITILFNKEIVSITGVYYSILKLLAWNNISIVDMISTYSELTIFFSNKDIDKAFSILRNFN